MNIDWNKLISKINTRAEKDLSDGVISGCSVLVYQEDKGIFRKNYGYASVNQKTPLQNDAIFRLASMTKPITTVAIMILSDRGLLSVDDEVCKYIPSFEKSYYAEYGKNGEYLGKKLFNGRVKIRDFLTHSSGLGTNESGEREFLSISLKDRLDIKSAAERFAHTLYDFAPASATSYCALMAFDVLGRIVEIVSGKRFDIFLQDEIFNSLGMKDTAFSFTLSSWKRTVAMSDRKDDRAVDIETSKDTVFGDYPKTYFSGAAGLISTMDDYFSFCQMLLNRGKFNGKQILSENAVKEMTRPQLSKEIMPPPVVWGYGVRIITEASYDSLPVGCYGWSGAYGAHFWIDPNNKIIALYMKNSVYDGGAGAVTAKNFEFDVTASLN